MSNVDPQKQNMPSKVWVYWLDSKIDQFGNVMEYRNYEKLICTGTLINIYETNTRSMSREYKSGVYSFVEYGEIIQKATVIDDNTGVPIVVDLFQCTFKPQKSAYATIFENGVTEKAIEAAIEYAKDEITNPIKDSINIRNNRLDTMLKKLEFRLDEKQWHNKKEYITDGFLPYFVNDNHSRSFVVEQEIKPRYLLPL